MHNKKVLRPALHAPCKQGSSTVLQWVTRKEPLSTLKILGMQSNSKQHSQVQVNLDHTWMALLQTLHYATIAFLQTSQKS